MQENKIQNLAVNSKYEIMTPRGWESFKGVVETTETRQAVILTTNKQTITATLNHRFYVDEHEKQAGEFQVGDWIDTTDGQQQIVSVEHTILDKVYDVFHSDNHIVHTAGFISHNCDEMGFLPPTIAKDFWTAIQPVLSTGGGCIVTSTPRSDEDQFADIWKQANDNIDEYGNPLPGGLGRNGFFPILVKWNEHPDRDEEWAKPFRASLGPARFAQEMECEFVTDESTLIDSIFLSRMQYSDPEFYTGQVRWYIEPVPNKTYLVALDPSLGTGNDYAAIQIFQAPEMIQVAEWQHNKTPTKGQIKMLMQMLYILHSTLKDHPDQQGEPTIYWTIENNTIGEAALQVIEDTGEENFPGVMVNEKRKPGATKRFRKGLYTSNSSKLSACAKLKSLIETDRMTIHSRPLIRELKNFISNSASYAAKPGEHDDLILATLLIVRLLNRVMSWMDEEESAHLREVVNPEEDDDALPMPILF